MKDQGRQQQIVGAAVVGLAIIASAQAPAEYRTVAYLVAAVVAILAVFWVSSGGDREAEDKLRELKERLARVAEAERAGKRRVFWRVVSVTPDSLYKTSCRAHKGARQFWRQKANTPGRTRGLGSFETSAPLLHCKERDPIVFGAVESVAVHVARNACHAVAR